MSASLRLRSAAAPVLLLLAGALGKSALHPERSLALHQPLDDFPGEVGEHVLEREETLSRGELRVLRPDDYLLRTYGRGGSEFDVFVAWYGRQRGGASIHSPRNCLPGSGWQPVEHTRAQVLGPYGPASVNRYLVEHESGARALVLYWYQGRGRMAANEYVVKWELLRDAVFRRRTDEALVRVVFPLRSDEAAPAERARAVVEEVAGSLAAFLPD